MHLLSNKVQKTAPCSGGGMEHERRPNSSFGVKELSEKELAFAKFIWDFSATKSENFGLKDARVAQLISTGKVAEKLKVNKSSYIRMEKAAGMGSISLKKLKKAAAAIDCEVVVTVVHKSGKSFSDVLWEKMLADAREKMKTKKHMVSFRSHVLVSVMKNFLQSPEYRRRHGWTERRQMSHLPQRSTGSPKYP
jgi:hypothetical protein